MPLTGFDIDTCNTASAIPGVGVLEYAPIDEVDITGWPPAILPAAYNQQTSAGVSSWYPLPYAVGSGSWGEEQQDNEQGSYFDNNISMLLPADTQAVRGELNNMRQHRYILRMTKNGMVFIIGTPFHPLEFQSKFDSGADGGDTRGHRITFKGSQLQKAPGYVPVF